MKQTINFSQFCDAFRDMNRNDDFTYDGKRALFDYLEEYAEDCGAEVELDVIALCCDYVEYADLKELQGDYPDIDSMEELSENTSVIMINEDSFIIQGF